MARQLLPITRWIAYPPQIGLDSKTPILIVLWKDAHAVGMFSVEAVLAFMIEGLPLTETLRVIDAQALADVLGALFLEEGGNARHIAIDGKTMRASKDSEGKAEHVLSAFCSSLQTVSRTRGLAQQGSGNSRCAEAPGAARLEGQDRHRGRNLLPEIDRCENRRTRGDYVFPVKDNQKTLRQDIETAFNEPVFPLRSWNSGVEKAHGRIEWRAIDVLPAEAAGIQGEWPTVRQICRVIRSRQVKKNAEWQTPQHEVVYLVSSLPAAASPQALLGVNRDHWRIEIMHRNKDVILGEDGYTNRCDNAPRNIFSLTGFVLKILKSVAPSPTRAIEHFQDDRNRAIRLFSGFY